MNDGIENCARVLALGLLIGGVACSESGSYPDGTSTNSGTMSTSSTASSQSNSASVSSGGDGGAGTRSSTSSTAADAGGSEGEVSGTGTGGSAGSEAAGGSGGSEAAVGSEAAGGSAGSQALGGSGAVGGNGGSGAAGGSQAAATTAGSGGGAGSCSAGAYVICEDFEGTDLGEVPEEWTRHGDAIGVADDEAYSGTRSLKMDAIPVWERRIYHEAEELGSAHWGRIFYKVDLPVPDAFVHSTLVALSGVGPEYGASEYRVVDTVKQAVDTPDVGSLHQFLYNVQPEDSGEFARQGPYDQAFDGEWHCAEYWIDAADQSYALYIDGEEELSFEDGAGEYDRSDIPESFSELRIGWINYQEAPPGFTAWIDDIAFGSERIGCGE